MTHSLEKLKKLEIKALPSFDAAHELFIGLFNQKNIEPAIISVEDIDSRSAIDEFDSLDSIVILPQGGESEMYASLAKLMERFIPTSIGLESTVFEDKLLEFARSKGIVVEANGEKSSKENLLIALEKHGSVGYFPNSITKDGKIAVERIRYFSKEIQDEISAASEGPLATEESKKSLNNSALISVGLSVGSEMALAAMQKGIQKFVFADPGKLHADLMGRLGKAFDHGWLGVNKSLYLRQVMLKLNPYLDITVFEQGLDPQNYQEIINEKWLTPDMQQNGGIMYVAEEADSWNAKMMTRKGVHSLPKGLPWHLFMFGDVAHRVTMSHETASDDPFLGYVGSADSAGDKYGSNLVKIDELLAMFASVGGFRNIPLVLLELIRDGKIGTHPGAEISRVPQSRGATLLVAASFFECLRLISSGQEVKSYTVINLEPSLNVDEAAMGQTNSTELKLEQLLSFQFFQKPKL